MAQELRRLLPDLARRRGVLERGLAGRAAELVFAGREDEARAALLEAARTAAAQTEGARSEGARSEGARSEGALAGFVHFVGAGPGEPDLLTLRAQRVLGEADIVLHDADVPACVLDLARRDAARAVAREGDAARTAAAGQRVVRLVTGDPDAACDAEAAGLREAGIACAVVPGLQR